MKGDTLALDRIKINLATYSYRTKGLQWGFIVALCIAIILMSGYLIHLAVVYQGEILDYSNKIARLERALKLKGLNIKPNAAKVDEQDLKQVESEMAFVRDLIVRDIFPWDVVLGAVERNMPKDIYLDRLEADAVRRDLDLRGTARSMEDITVFLENLDLNEIFRETKLIKFSVESGNGSAKRARRLIHFDISCDIETNAVMRKIKLWTKGPANSSRKVLE